VYTIRPARPDDAAALARLAELEEAAPLTGRVLVAETGGEPIAALGVDDGRAVADIFRPTASAVRMLRGCRAELVARTPAPRSARFRPPVFPLLRRAEGWS
jgi:hypothetical protein